MKRYAVTALVAGCCAALAAEGTNAPSVLAPQPYYGKIAQEVIKRLERKHVLRHPFDDEMSRRAWTNLVANYDYSRMVFRKPDIDRFAAMETKIDDALRDGDVSFVYDMHRLFLERIAERVDFVTNLLLKTEFDFPSTRTTSGSARTPPGLPRAKSRTDFGASASRTRCFRSC